MNNLPDEIVTLIASHLDIFNSFQLAHVNKRFHTIIFTRTLKSSIQQYFFDMYVLKTSITPFIRRINNDGVVYGECEQCATLALLYTQFDGFDERCICLDDCAMHCNRCHSNVKVHSMDHACPHCLRRSFLSPLTRPNIRSTRYIIHPY